MRISLVRLDQCLQSRALLVVLLFLLGVWVVASVRWPADRTTETESTLGSQPSSRGKTGKGIGPEVQKRHADHAQRLASKKYQEMGMISDQANYDTVLADGSINPGVLAVMEIDSGKLNELQAVVDKYWALAESRMAERIVRDSRRGDGCFLIPADRQSGDELLFNLEQDVRLIVGGDSAKAFMRGMHATKKFGWFVKLDIKIKLVESGDLNENTPVLDVECRDPGTGKLIRSFSRLSPSSEHYSRMFGRGLSFADSK